MPTRGPRLFGVAVLTMLSVAAFAPAAGADVVLNEVNCEATDWVELVNASDTDVDVSGWIISDDPIDPPGDRFVFPAGTVIAGNDDLVLESVPQWDFGISCSGADTLRLADSSENLVEEVYIPSQVTPGETWGRYPNATGEFGRTIATKGAPNQPSSGGSPGDEAAWMFEPSEVVEIDLDVPQESLDALDIDPREYVDATFSLTTTGGTYGPLEVGVHLKGGLGSFRPLTGKAAFKVKFNHSVGGQRFLGLEKLTLNNMVQDFSMIHEVLTYTSFRAMGIPAPRTGYAYVRVNGDDYGLYLNLETLDRVSLPRWPLETRHLLEGELGADATPDRAAALEIDEGSETDLSDLEALIAAANDTNGDWSDGMAGVADLDEMTRMWAVERYVGHWDGYSYLTNDRHPNNYYLHSDLAGLFRMLPWGSDQTWVDRIPFLPGGGILSRSCFADPSCAADFRAAVFEARSTIVGLGLDTLAETTADALEPWQAMDPRREYSPQQIETAVAGVRAFIAARPGDVDDPDFWPDVAAPETAISGPAAVIRTRKRRVKVPFGFNSSEDGSRFECRLDHGRWAACSSPLRLTVARGHHIFLVRATDAAGNLDSSPARNEWRVRRPRPPRVGLRAVR